MGPQHSASDTLGRVSQALDPRAEYRRRMQRRQTLVIGGTLAVMAFLAAICLLIWSGLVRVPFDPGFSSASEEQTLDPQPCPPADATTVDIASIPVNVYNGTDTPGLAGDVAAILGEAGLTVNNTADWPRGEYPGDVLLTTSEAGLANAYSLAQAFQTQVQVSIDENAAADDTTVSVVLGARYDRSLGSSSEIGQLPTGEAISAPTGCIPSTPTPTPQG